MLALSSATGSPIFTRDNKIITSTTTVELELPVPFDDQALSAMSFSDITQLPDSIRDILRQVQAACTALPRRPALAFGHSAGGHLAAMLLASGHVPAALPVSGVFELAPLRHTTIGTALQLSVAEAQALSPRFLPPPARGWLHAVVGSAESTEFRRQTRDFAAAWGGTAEELPGLNHFTVLAPFSDPDSPLITRMLGAIAA
jgi:arylformamidase